MLTVDFIYYTGLKNEIFRNAKLVGSWDDQGLYSSRWSSVEMKKVILEDGCPGFQATVRFDESQLGYLFFWGVLADGPSGTNNWAINLEVNDHNSNARYVTFTLTKDITIQSYYFTNCRRLGSNKKYVNPIARNRELVNPSISFSVWAPNAQAVNLVFGNRKDGYINVDGKINSVLVDPHGVKSGPYSLRKEIVNNLWTGIWTIDSTDNAKLSQYDYFDHEPYMFEIIKDNGQKAYRTDIYSRCQIGSGNYDPVRSNYDSTLEDDKGIYIGTRDRLDGTVSCSVIINPELIAKEFREVDGNGNVVWPESKWESEEDFWRNEFDPHRPIPTRIEDLTIYEFHVNGLGYKMDDPSTYLKPGNLQDAINHLDYMVELGINCVEVMPLQEYEASAAWGYGTSHFFTLEYSVGGRDQYKHFVRACHQRGIAVILDVVYNHYHHFAERAQRNYDSVTVNKDIYHWYEGKPEDYSFERGGYIDNYSTGDAPAYWNNFVRQQFISSAAVQVSEFHIDGFRVDQVTSIIESPKVRGNQSLPTEHIKSFGKKFLREWSTTVKMIKPSCFLIAEDHLEESNEFFEKVTMPLDVGGLGFGSRWYSKFYHHLIGDTHDGETDFANIIKTAGIGDKRALAMEILMKRLLEGVPKKVFYSESHDEAGNSENKGNRSMRTIAAAVNGIEHLSILARPFAEARCRFAFAMTILTPSIPMFFMGEEIGASKIYRYYPLEEQLKSREQHEDGFLFNREDFYKEYKGNGKYLFRFYQDIIKFRNQNSCIRYGSLKYVHVHNDNRTLAFLRSYDNEECLIVGCLNNSHFSFGYTINSSNITPGRWREVFNSNSAIYGGDDMGNGGRVIFSNAGSFNCIIPKNSVMIFVKI